MKSMKFHSVKFTIIIKSQELWYSSEETWYPHACWQLIILGWRLHHAYSIWMSAHHVRPHQANRRVCAPMIVALIWTNFLMKLNIICIYVHDELTNIVSVCSNQSLNRLPYWKAAQMQLHTVLIWCPIAWCAIVLCGELIWHREWILHWRLNIH